MSSHLLKRLATALLLAGSGCVWAVEPDTFSKVVSFQYESTLEEPGTPIFSRVVSFQYFDTLGDENVTYATTPSASFFYPDGVSLYTSGTVKTPGGAPVVGASITLKQSGTLFWQGVSDSSGAFVTPGLGVAKYSVTAKKTGYQTLFTNVLQSTSGLQSLDLRILPLPAPPASSDVIRDATTAEKQKPQPATSDDIPKLLIYNGSSFVPVAASGVNALRTDRMTVVMSHGMGSSPTEWAVPLAELIDNHHALGTNTPNIVAWDWHFPAGITSSNGIIPIDNAARQGPKLGQELLTRLGSGYSQRLHFIGHSLGTIVNRYACDFVHAQMPRASSNPASYWNSLQTQPHITLLDEAEVASVAGTRVINSTKVASKLAGTQSGIAVGVAAAYLDWKGPVPASAIWVDNYISLVGVQHADAVNVCLLKQIKDYNLGDPAASVIFAHSYAHLFYRQTVVPTGTPPAVGFALSHEKSVNLPPSGTGLSHGSLWYEDVSTPAPLDLLHQPNPQPHEANAVIVAAMFAKTKAALNNARQNGVLEGYETGIRWPGDIANTLITKTQKVAVSIKQKIGNFWDALSDTESDALNTISPDSQLNGSFIQPVFSMSFSNQAAPAPAPFAMKGVSVQDAAADAEAGGEASAWITVNVPADAGMMAFDFKVTGEPVDDEVVCAINGQNVFALPAMFTPNGVTVSTDMMDISAYAGQQIEVFFGLASGTSTDCVLEVDGLRFVTVPVPKLALEDLGANVRLDWPVAASGWVLETSETLAPGSWQLVTGLDQAVAQDGVASLMQAKASTMRFYRLRRTP